MWHLATHLPSDPKHCKACRLAKAAKAANAAKVAKHELALECDYTYEADAQMRFKRLLEAETGAWRSAYHVPAVIPELSSSRVLCTELVPGVPIDRAQDLPQEERDRLGTLVLRMTLQELFRWRYMQTDPNWSNFLYDSASGTLNLIDFGAAKEYPKPFVDDLVNVVRFMPYLSTFFDV